MRPATPAADRATPENAAHPPGLVGALLITSRARLLSTVTPGTSSPRSRRTDRSLISVVTHRRTLPRNASPGGPRLRSGTMTVMPDAFP